ncbi:hypothetical protein SD71_01745 [Cohnella kolymensis]|uniref:Putative amidase domain-containing protein n=1 Tax=Cohnella kolymensis TaxID=1590652 RepID=A0ABR5A8R4_9BACL|nr:amidase domain-containing protein [Cohnella kolymensis]KIL37408.1 hypothetical protein SD71_01745 [Cohnella kolymensis]
MPSTKSDWKDALFGYVNMINEAALLFDERKLKEIPDEEHRRRMTRRIHNTAQRDPKIPLKPIRSEMRARIERHKLKGAEAVADVSIHLVRSYEQRSQPWLEERVERERLRFVRIGKSWRLDSVQPLDPERASEVAVPLEEEVTSDDYGRISVMPSIPYMNPKALYNAKSRVYPGSATGSHYGYGRLSRGIPYRRESAVAYAERWWNEGNPNYETFDVNCTNYVSQCLFAGGAAMNYTGRRESGWWYKGRSKDQELWSYSWAVANALQHYLAAPRAAGFRAEAVDSPEQLHLGDLICYDFDGNGRFQHNTIVTAFTPDGMPLVNANTVSSRHRYWDYRDSYAWTEQTRYRFFHIADEF